MGATKLSQAHWKDTRNMKQLLLPSDPPNDKKNVPKSKQKPCIEMVDNSVDSMRSNAYP